MNKEALIKNITDQIKEVQLKLGFASETIRLYYPYASVNALIGSTAADAGSLVQELKEAFSVPCRLGSLTFHARHGGRIEVCIPPEGAQWVHTQVKDPRFLSQLIALFKENSACTLQEICAVFDRQEAAYSCRRMPPGSDFDYVLHFMDASVDEYYYCIHMEMGHTIYHRFLEADYEALL